MSRPQFRQRPVEKCGKPADNDDGSSSSVLHPSGNKANLAFFTAPRKDMDERANDCTNTDAVTNGLNKTSTNN